MLLCEGSGTGHCFAVYGIVQGLKEVGGINDSLGWSGHGFAIRVDGRPSHGVSQGIRYSSFLVEQISLVQH